eukprot:16635-Chlamydomonas_euryale.AAC.2
MLHTPRMCGMTRRCPSCCRQNKASAEHPTLTWTSGFRVLKSLLAGGVSPEHEITGITNPFLQVRVAGPGRRVDLAVTGQPSCGWEEGCPAAIQIGPCR